MPSPEHRSEEPGKEPEPHPAYWRASSFDEEQTAGEAYFQAQEAVFNSSFDLSAYRFQLDAVWHVAVLGNMPDETFDQIIQEILASGVPTGLSADILTVLNERRLRARRLGPWVEGHYRPGKTIGE